MIIHFEAKVLVSHRLRYVVEQVATAKYPKNGESYQHIRLKMRTNWHGDSVDSSRCDFIVLVIFVRL